MGRGAEAEEVWGVRGQLLEHGGVEQGPGGLGP